MGYKGVFSTTARASPGRSGLTAPPRKACAALSQRRETANPPLPHASPDCCAAGSHRSRGRPRAPEAATSRDQNDERPVRTTQETIRRGSGLPRRSACRETRPLQGQESRNQRAPAASLCNRSRISLQQAGAGARAKGGSSQGAPQTRIWNDDGRLPNIDAAAVRSVCNLQAAERRRTMRRPLPQDPCGGRPALPQVQRRARLLQ